MIRKTSRRAFLLGLLAGAAATARTQSPAPDVGIVVMHGKGGAPTKLVAGLADWLSKAGYLVANLEMPWSGRRDYDVPVDAAVAEVDRTIEALRSKGARKVFVCGHSLGGLFALRYAGLRPLDGLVAIAPGGDPSTRFVREKLGGSVERARRLVAEGKGGERETFDDFENAKGIYPVHSTAASYLSWFDPEGAMNQERAVAAVLAETPVLYIVPTADYPGLLRVKDVHFSRLPRNPRTRLAQPVADHRSAPWDSREEIARFIGEVTRP